MPPTDKYAWAHNARWVVDELPNILEEQNKLIKGLVEREVAVSEKEAVRAGISNFRKGLILFGASSIYPVARVIARVFFHYDLP